MKTPEEARERVIAALRSGKYTQGRGKLCDTQGAHCCLGVVCREAIKDGVPINLDRDVEQGVTFFDEDANGLPRRAQAWLGVTTSNPLYDGRSAMSLNDVDCLTFEQIADRMERGVTNNSPRWPSSP